MSNINDLATFLNLQLLRKQAQPYFYGRPGVINDIDDRDHSVNQNSSDTVRP
jgi:hypothetical protein